MELPRSYGESTWSRGKSTWSRGKSGGASHHVYNYSCLDNSRV